ARRALRRVLRCRASRDRRPSDRARRPALRRASRRGDRRRAPADPGPPSRYGRARRDRCRDRARRPSGRGRGRARDDGRAGAPDERASDRRSRGHRRLLQREPRRRRRRARGARVRRGTAGRGPRRHARASDRADRLMPTSILALGVMLSAFLVGLVIGGPYIQLLRRLRVGQNIRREGPSRDFAKQGIPTMGGLLFIGVVAFLWVFVLFLLPESEREVYVPQTIVPIGALVAVGALGAIDDWVNVTYGFGIRGRHKLVWQTIVGLAAAVYIQRHFGVDEVFIPLVGGWVIGGVIFVLVALIAIVATSNGVNLTDGMDGLAGGTRVSAFL